MARHYQTPVIAHQSFQPLYKIELICPLYNIIREYTQIGEDKIMAVRLVIFGGQCLSYFVFLGYAIKKIMKIAAVVVDYVADSIYSWSPEIYQFSLGISSYVIITCCGLVFKISTAAFVIAFAKASFCSLVLPGKAEI